jgi:hypothetical protein
MSYVPSGAKWFVAQLILEIEVEGDNRNVLHKNLVLIEATSAEEAYEKSLQLGKDNEISYENPNSKAVRMKFRGIGQLDVVGNELKHGTEILFEEHIAVPEDKILQWVPSKTLLSVFRPIEPSPGPDYASQEIMEEVVQVLKEQ